MINTRAFFLILIITFANCENQTASLSTSAENHTANIPPKAPIVINQQHPQPSKNVERGSAKTNNSAEHISTDHPLNKTANIQQILESPAIQEIKKQIDKVEIPTNQQEAGLTHESKLLSNFSKEVKQQLKDLSQSTFNTFGNFDTSQMNRQIPNQLELEDSLHKEELYRQNQELSPWIAEEIANNAYAVEGIVVESFQVMLEDDGISYNFRWNPPKSQTLHLKIMLLEMIEDGSLMIIKDSGKDQFVEVSYRQEGHTSYNTLGKVYIDRTFIFNFDSDYKYFRLTNHIGRPIFAIVDLQKLQQKFAVEGVIKNEHFNIPASKLEQIAAEVTSGEKLREHSYKYQWGFLDNQYTHDSRLLGITGIELLIIILSAAVQVYYIKTLLDNRAIV